MTSISLEWSRKISWEDVMLWGTNTNKWYHIPVVHLQSCLPTKKVNFYHLKRFVGAPRAAPHRGARLLSGEGRHEAVRQHQISCFIIWQRLVVRTPLFCSYRSMFLWAYSCFFFRYSSKLHTECISRRFLDGTAESWLVYARWPHQVWMIAEVCEWDGLLAARLVVKAISHNSNTSQLSPSRALISKNTHQLLLIGLRNMKRPGEDVWVKNTKGSRRVSSLK